MDINFLKTGRYTTIDQFDRLAGPDFVDEGFAVTCFAAACGFIVFSIRSIRVSIRTKVAAISRRIGSFKTLPGLKASRRGSSVTSASAIGAEEIPARYPTANPAITSPTGPIRGMRHRGSMFGIMNS